MAEKRRDIFETFLFAHAERHESVEQFLRELAQLKRMLRGKNLDLSPCASSDVVNLERALILATGARAKTIPVSQSELRVYDPRKVEWHWLHSRLAERWHGRLSDGLPQEAGIRFSALFAETKDERWSLIKALFDRIMDEVWNDLPAKFFPGTCAGAGSGMRTALYYAAGFTMAGMERDAAALIPLVKYLRWFLPLGMEEGRGFLWLVGR